MPSIFSIGLTLSRTMPSMWSSSLPRRRAGARLVGEHVLGLVELALAVGVDLVALGRGRAAIFSASASASAAIFCASARLRAARISASAAEVMRSASRSASRCAPIRSVSLRRSAISRSRAVKACSSAWTALARAASDAAMRGRRSCVFLAMSIAFWISAISTFWSRSIAKLPQVALA